MPEVFYPLRLFVCTDCWLVQTEMYNRESELFNEDYAYFSSVSKTWIEHTTSYFKTIVEKLGLGPSSLVFEIASNDGYLLKNFINAGIPCVGIEPTRSTAAVARQSGVPVVEEFFDVALAERLLREQGPADLIIGNNVYAHVPDINGFTAGLATLLAPDGVITLEFPHLLRLLEQNQFDTVYHEHYSYLSLGIVSRIFDSFGLRIFDVEELTTHGGSLRVFGCHASSYRKEVGSVQKLLEYERDQGLFSERAYKNLSLGSRRIRNDLLRFLIDASNRGDLVLGYGAAAKGNTLLNYAGIKADLLPAVADVSSHKQGKWLPGSRIPVLSPEEILLQRPEYLLILPWNLRREVASQMREISAWGGRFVVASPRLEIF